MRAHKELRIDDDVRLCATTRTLTPMFLNERHIKGVGHPLVKRTFILVQEKKKYFFYFFQVSVLFFFFVFFLPPRVPSPICTCSFPVFLNFLQWQKQRWFRIGSKDVSKRFSRTGPKEVAKRFTLSPSQSDRKTVLTEPVSKRSQNSFDFLLLTGPSWPVRSCEKY